MAGKREKIHVSRSIQQEIRWVREGKVATRQTGEDRRGTHALCGDETASEVYEDENPLGCDRPGWCWQQQLYSIITMNKAVLPTNRGWKDLSHATALLITEPVPRGEEWYRSMIRDRNRITGKRTLR